MNDGEKYFGKAYRDWKERKLKTHKVINMGRKKQTKRKCISYEQQVAHARLGENLCGYLRSHYMRKDRPNGLCALTGLERCATAAWQGDDIDCPVYAKFLEYRAMKRNEPTDIEELRRYLRR